MVNMCLNRADDIDLKKEHSLAMDRGFTSIANLLKTTRTNRQSGEAKVDTVNPNPRLDHAMLLCEQLYQSFLDDDLSALTEANEEQQNHIIKQYALFLVAQSGIDLPTQLKNDDRNIKKILREKHASLSKMEQRVLLPVLEICEIQPDKESIRDLAITTMVQIHQNVLTQYLDSGEITKFSLSNHRLQNLINPQVMDDHTAIRLIKQLINELEKLSFISRMKHDSYCFIGTVIIIASIVAYISCIVFWVLGDEEIHQYSIGQDYPRSYYDPGYNDPGYNNHDYSWVPSGFGKLIFPFFLFQRPSQPCWYTFFQSHFCTDNLPALRSAIVHRDLAILFIHLLPYIFACCGLGPTGMSYEHRDGGAVDNVGRYQQKRTQKKLKLISDHLKKNGINRISYTRRYSLLESLRTSLNELEKRNPEHRISIREETIETPLLQGAGAENPRYGI